MPLEVMELKFKQQKNYIVHYNFQPDIQADSMFCSVTVVVFIILSYKCLEQKCIILFRKVQ